MTISSFEIIKPISRGAYGHVVLAAKRTTRDLYAIKVLRKNDMRRKNQVQRIQTERDVLATAAHPYVVNLVYSFQSRHHLYLVMEFVNGGETPAPSESVPPEFDRAPITHAQLAQHRRHVVAHHFAPLREHLLERQRQRR